MSRTSKDRNILFLQILSLLPVLMAVTPATGTVLYEEGFEDDQVGTRPFVGPGRWNSVSQGGNGCLNLVVDATESPIASGQALHLKDPSSTTGNLLLEYDDIGTPETVRLSFHFYEAPSANGPLSVVLGGLRGAARFAELQIGGGELIARQANGASDASPDGSEYARGAVIAVDVIINSTAVAVTYATSNGLNGSAGADRYDVYINGTLAIDDADPADYSGAIDSLSLRTTDAAAGVDLHLDNIRIETINAEPASPDFSVTAYPPSQSASLCGTITWQVSVTAEGGFAGFVYFAAAGLPAGAIAQFNPAFVTAPGQSVATVSIPPTLSEGNYPLVIQASAGGKTRSAPVSFVVTDATRPQYALTVAATAHGNVTANPLTGPYVCGAVVALTAVPEAGYRLKAWHGTDNDASASLTNSVTMRSDKTVSAEFELCTYALTTQVVNGHGTLAADPPAGPYPCGLVVPLTATPDAGYRLKGWIGTDDDTSTSLANSVTLNGDTTVTVAFEPLLPATYSLSAYAQGQGTITLDPDSGTYDGGTTVQITAHPANGWRLARWEGAASGSTNPVAVVMTGDKSVTAVFEQVPADRFQLTTSVIGGHGTLLPGDETYEANAVVSLSATAEAGYRVKRWSGTDDDASTAVTNAVTMTADRNVTVEFEAIPAVRYQLTASVAGGSGTLSPTSGTHDAGTVVSLTATPASGSRVKAWTGTDDDASTAATNTVTMTADATVTVTFETIPAPPPAPSGGGAAALSPVPAAPSQGTLAVSEGQIEVRWTDNSTDETGFELQRRIEGSAGTSSETQWIDLARVAANVTVYVDKTVKPGVTYSYRVRAVAGSAVGNWLSLSAVTTPAAPTRPTAPADITLTGIRHDQVVLSWTHAAEDETLFVIHRRVGENEWQWLAALPADATSYTDSTVAPLTEYAYRVAAGNDAGLSEWAVSSRSVTPAAPAVSPPAAVVPSPAPARELAAETVEPPMPAGLCGAGMAQAMLISLLGVCALRFGARR